jgi:hypothetical protein
VNNQQPQARWLVSSLFIAIALAIALLPTSSSAAVPEIPVFDDVSATARLKTTDEKSFGLQWADYNNDGWMDFYVGRHGGNGAELWRNRGNGTFQNVSAASGIKVSGDRHACDWGDLNGDGWIDLFCTVAGSDHVLINQSNGTFENQASQLGFGGGSGRTVSLLDYDGDGRLDVLYGDTQFVRLWRNLGSSFTVVSTFGRTGNEGPRSHSTADYDQDGNPDAFIGKFPRTDWALLRGTGSGFTDATTAAGLNLAGTQAATWGDYDNDGDLDMFIAGWLRFCCRKPFRLMQNQGDGTFVDVTSTADLFQAPARVGLWGDFNNDGWLDLFLVNGMKNSDGINVADTLYLNKGNGTFFKAGGTNLEGPSQGSGDSAAWADYDHDGFLDILVGNGSGELSCKPGYTPYCIGPDKLYRNRGNANTSFQARLIADDDPFGYGTRVWATTSMGTQFREMNDQLVGKSQNAQVIHFGLGANAQIGTLRVVWPDGDEDIFSNVPANTVPVTIKQGVGILP